MSNPNEEVRITLRLPARLRDALAKSATERARSMNGEIVALLEVGLENDLASLKKELILMEARKEAQFEVVKFLITIIGQLASGDPKIMTMLANAIRSLDGGEKVAEEIGEHLKKPRDSK